MADQQSMLDEVYAEVNALSEDEIKAAAAKILARQAKARAGLTEERKDKMRAQEKRRREVQKAIVAKAKELGVTAKTVAA